MDAGAAYVNAGCLSLSHVMLLSATGLMKQGLNRTLNPSIPRYIKPRLDADFLKWSDAIHAWRSLQDTCLRVAP